MRIRAPALSGRAMSATQTGVQAGAARGIEDQGSLYTFDPAASLTLDIELAAGGTCELIFIDGHAPNEIAAPRSSRSNSVSRLSPARPHRAHGLDARPGYAKACG